MQLLSLEEYFKFVGVEAAVSREAGCEICGAGDPRILRDSVRVTDGLRVSLSVVCCRKCGHLYQVPRFDERFYRSYYAAAYRKILSGSRFPEPSLIEDQLARGEHIYESLKLHLPERGAMLDVGASAGGVMAAFRKRGWRTYGTDPDAGSVEYGIRRLGADLAVTCAEDMELAPDTFDLVLITGSLEHVFDPNRVLSICRRASKAGALLFLEGRGLAQARHVGACGHNHRRFLTQHSIGLFMAKHGWSVLWTTDRELSGPTRPLSVFGLGEARDAEHGASALAEPLLQSRLADIVRQFDAWKIK